MRVLLNIALAAATAYGLMLLAVFLMQSRLVYFPDVGRGHVSTPRAAGLDFESVQLRTSDGVTLDAWWVPAREQRGAVVMFHGNAGNISHRIGYLAMFNRFGYSALLIDYRGYGRSSGSPSEAGTYRDAEAAWRHLTADRKLRAQDIVIFGESLGAGVATWLAAHVSANECAGRPAARASERGAEPSAAIPPPTAPVAAGTSAPCPLAVILASAFTSVPDLGAKIYPWLPVRLLARIEYGNLARLRTIAVPVLIAHSRDDEIVPFAHGEALFAAARGPKQFLVMSGGHNEGFLFTRAEWAAAVGAFLERARQGG